VAVDPRARLISESEMQAHQVAGLRAEAPEVDARTGLVERLVATQTALRAHTPSRCFGAGDPGGAPGSMCTLFLDEDVNGRRVATVEEVGTLPAQRGRGLARAVVGAAVAHAGRWGAELIVVPADADDWPQVMYARLGFAPVGRQVALTRRLRRRAAGRAGSDSVAGDV
jgi:GNAT superfamily N-acetyltransferase